MAKEEASVEVPEPKESADLTGEATKEAEETESEESKKSRASQRIRELNARAKEAEAKAQSLAEKLQALTGQAPEAGTQPVQPTVDEPIIKPGEEIDGIELDKRLRAREANVLQRADALVTLRNKQNDAINRINSEALQAVTAYPELDPDSENFNRELSETVTEAVEAYVKADPYNASVKKFVAKLMKPYKSAVAKEVGQATENIAKQVSETALRPTSIRKPEKAAKDKTIAELEAELGVVQA